MQPLLCHDFIKDFRSEIESGEPLPEFLGADIIAEDLIRHATLYAAMHKLPTETIVQAALRLRSE